MGLAIARQEPLETEIRVTGVHALVMLAGEVDVSTVESLYEELAALAREGVCHVALNLAEVTFMDSTGLALLVSEHKRSESMGGELIVFSPSRGIRRLFEVAGMDSFFNVRPKMAHNSSCVADAHQAVESPADASESVG